MSKIEIPPITTQFASTAALNFRLEQIENELNDKVLYRKNPGTEPNEMNNHLDMNFFSFLNVGEPADGSAPITKDYADDRYIQYTEVVDNYNSTASNLPLSAARGRDLDLRIKTLDPTSTIISEDRFSTVTASGGVLDLTDETINVWLVDLDQDITDINLPTVDGNQALPILILFIQDSTGGHTVDGWGSVLWEEGVQPVMSTLEGSVTSVAILITESEIYGVDRDIASFDLELSRTSTTVEIDNEAGAGVTIPEATEVLAGLLSASDKEKLNDIEQTITDAIDDAFGTQFNDAFDTRFSTSFDTAFDAKVDGPDADLLALIDSRVAPETDLGNVVRFLEGDSDGVTDYPIGSIILVVNEDMSSPPPFNFSLNIYINDRSGEYSNSFSDSTGTQLDGTWHSRGGFAGTLFLAQRVA